MFKQFILSQISNRSSFHLTKLTLQGALIVSKYVLIVKLSKWIINYWICAMRTFDQGYVERKVKSIITLVI